MRLKFTLFMLSTLAILFIPIQSEAQTLRQNSKNTAQGRRSSSPSRSMRRLAKRAASPSELEPVFIIRPDLKPEEMRKRTEQFSRRLVELTNRERLKQGLMPLKRQEDLENIANWFARDMADKQYLNHTDSSSRTVKERATSFKYEDWDELGENIASGYQTPEEVFEGWMKSPGHRKNMLSDNFTEVGFGYAQPKNCDFPYWVQEFGSRMDIYPLIIDLDGDEATKAETLLHVHGKGWAKEMRFRCDDGDWTHWMPYETSYNWRLCTEKGLHTVKVELRREGTVRRTEATVVIRKCMKPDKN